MNEIHPSVVIEGDVTLGENNRIQANSVLIGPLTIGDDNLIGPNTVIGTPGQDTRNPRYDASRCPIVIGNHNIIRELTTIQKPCYEDITLLGDHVFIMSQVHVPHDAIIQDYAVITPMVALAGITRVLTGANVGVGASLHQYVVLGQYSMIAMGAVVTKNVRPFTKYIPSRPLSVNTYALDKYGLMDHVEEISAYVLSGVLPTSPNIREIVEAYEAFHTKSRRQEYLPGGT